jgi:hypothetical protein
MRTLGRTTDDVRKYFASQGCELMGEYLGALVPMAYKCKCGQIGRTSWNNFTHGKRCGHCAKHGLSKKRSLEEVKRIFSERGCEFLDTEFKGIHFPHHYRCKCGRQAEITFAGFHHQQQYCRECGLNKIRGSHHPGGKYRRGSTHYCWRPDREQKRLDELFRKKCYKALGSTLKATGKQKVGHTSDMLGYGPKELQAHITAHPHWNKVKDGDWHIDHIFPIEAFLENGITDVRLINCLENLQPLSQKENNSKHAKYNKDDFEKWLATKA